MPFCGSKGQAWLMAAVGTTSRGKQRVLGARNQEGKEQQGEPTHAVASTWPLLCGTHTHSPTHKCTLMHLHLIHAHVTQTHMQLHYTYTHSMSHSVHMHPHWSRFHMQYSQTRACTHMPTYNPFQNDGFSWVENTPLICVDLGTSQQKVPE